MKTTILMFREHSEAYYNFVEDAKKYIHDKSKKFRMYATTFSFDVDGEKFVYSNIADGLNGLPEGEDVVVKPMFGMDDDEWLMISRKWVIGK